jgi:hypothetical protein
MGGFFKNSGLGTRGTFGTKRLVPGTKQAPKSGGPGVLAIGGGNRPGSVPGERRLFDGIRITATPKLVPGT